MSSRTFILQCPPLEAIEVDSMLGRFVAHPRDPKADFEPGKLEDLSNSLNSLPAPVISTMPEIRTCGRGDFNINGVIKLFNLFGIRGVTQRISEAELTGSLTTTHKMQNFRHVFDSLKKNPAIGPHLLKLLERNSGQAYFAVGALVVTDGSVHILDTKNREFGADASLPDTICGTAAEVGGGLAASSTGSIDYSWSGPKLCAIQYYKVTRSFLKPGNCAVGKQAYADSHGVFEHGPGTLEVEEVWHVDDMDDVRILEYRPEQDI